MSRQRWIRRASCAAVCCAMLGCASPLEEAKKAIAGGQFEAAQEIAVEALEDHPKDGNFYTVLAEAQLGLSDPDSAAPLAERGVELRPESAYAHAVAGLAFGQSQRLSASCEAFGKAWALDRAEIEARRGAVLGILPQAIEHARQAGELERAVTCYTLLETLDPAQFEAQHKAAFQEIGRAYAVRLRDVGRLAESLALWESLASRYPEEQVAYSREQGLTFAAQGDLEAARAALDVYVSRASAGGAEAARCYDVGAALDGQGRLALASDYYKRALDTEPKHSDAQRAYVLALLRLQREPEATPWLEAFLGDARRDRPLTAEDAYKLSRALIELGWGAQAEQVLSHAHGRFSEDVAVAIGLAERRLQSGDFAGSEEVLRQTVEALLKQPQGEGRTAAFGALAGWLEIQDRRPLAIQILQRATAQAPEPPLLLVLAKLYAASRQVDAFEQTLLRYVEVSGGTRAARIEAAELMLRRQSAMRVGQVLEPLLKESPGDDQAVQLLGKVYALQGRGAEEAALYERWALASAQPALAFLEVGDRLAAGAQVQAAQGAYDRAAALDPAQGVEVSFRKGVLFHRLGKADESQKAFDAAVAKASKPQEVLERMLGFFTEEQDPTKALAVLDALVAQDPENPAWYFFRGEQWMLLGQEPKARAAFVEHALRAPSLEVALKKGATVLVNRASFRAALALMDDFEVARPDTTITLRLRGELYADHATLVSRGGADPEQVMLLREQSRKQWAAYVESLAKAGDTERLISSAATLASRGQYALSVRAFELVPGGAIPSVQREAFGRALVMEGRKQESVQQFDQYIEGLSAGDAKGKALLALGLFLNDEGLGAESARYLAQAVDEAKGATQREAFRISAMQTARGGDREGVFVLVDRAIERTDDRPRMMREVAEVLVRIGEDAQAIRWYRALLKLRPNASDIVLDMATLAQRAGDPEEAMAMLRSFAEVSATPSLTWQSIGQFLRDSGYPEQALEAYEAALRNQLEPDPRLFLEIARLHCVLNRAEAGLPLLRRYVEAYSVRAAGSKGGLVGGGRVSPAARQAYLTVVQMLEDTQQQTYAEQFAAEAGLRLDDPLPFWLRRIAFASRRGDLTAAMFWTGRSLQASGGLGLAPLVVWMAQEGLYHEAVRLVDEELDMGAYDAALEHTLKLAPRIALYDGSQAFERRLAALLGDGLSNLDVAQVLSERLIARGQLDEAVVWLGRMVRAKGRPEDRLLRGQLLLATGQPDQALRALEPLVTAPPSTYHLRQTAQAVDALLDANQPALAEAILGLALSTGHAELLPLLVDVRLGQGRLSDGLADVEAALHDDAHATTEGERSEALASVVVFARHGYSAEAKRLIERVRPADPDPSFALTEVEVLALARDESLAAAVEAFQQRWPSEESAESLAQTLLRAGAFAQGAQVARALIGSASHRRALAALALSIAASRASGEALDALVEQFLAARTDRYRALLDAALLLSDQGAFERADILLTQALELVGGEAAPYERLAEIKYLMGDLTGAIDALNQAALRRPDRADTLLSFAIQTSHGPDPRLAAAAYQLYLTASPRDPSAVFARARLQLLAGSEGGARSTLDDFIAQSDLPDRAREEAFSLLVSLQSWSQAEALVEALPPADELAPSTLLSLCHLWLATGQDARAAETLEVFSASLARSARPLEDRLAAAELFRQTGKLAVAERFIAAAVEAEPNSAAPRLYRSLLRLRGGDVEGGLLDLTFVADHGHDPLRQLTPAVVMLIEDSQIDAATPFLMRVLNAEHVPTAQRAAWLLSIFTQANQASALIPFLAAHRPGWLHHTERNPWLLHAIIQALIASDPDEALTRARFATLHQPQEPAHWDALARAALHHKLPDEARAAAERALLLSRGEDRKFALQTLGRILAASDPSAAQRLWLSALRLDRRADFAWTAALYLELAGLVEPKDPAAAVRFAKHAIALQNSPLALWP